MAITSETLNGVTYNIISGATSWKLTHDATNVLYLDNNNHTVKTINQCYESNSFKDIVYYVLFNNLNHNSFIISDYQNFKTEALKDLDPVEDAAIIELILSYDENNYKLRYKNNTVLDISQMKKASFDENVVAKETVEEILDFIYENNLVFPQESEYMVLYPHYYES